MGPEKFAEIALWLLGVLCIYLGYKTHRLRPKSNDIVKILDRWLVWYFPFGDNWKRYFTQETWPRYLGYRKQQRIGLLVAFLLFGVYIAKARLSQSSLAISRPVAETKYKLDSLRDYLEKFRNKCGFYPDSLDLVEGATAIRAKCPQQYGLSNQMLIDGWNRHFILSRNGGSVTVLSFGADGVEGGDDLSAEVSSGSSAN